ncbi:vWA domain-containing protein [Shimia biformata]|uniref:vWA domain-containing protein n=1 Tax=Shimia biformata TaxID=1294299 RepID=UPI00195010D5|nr:vWA domain-containing protein [Shimia biformata]
MMRVLPRSARAPLAAAALVAATTALPASAQDRPSAILVLDGSGSMWGQIDGTAKITIAQDVVEGLLTTLPRDQALGLTVYGHRRKGDCTDIETIVAPGTATRDQIAAAVRGIKPKGKTPMLDAVRQAAEALRYTEDAATVILVSDGVETCNADPCAAARALEEAGVNFTAHVVGFDVSDKTALAQMQCLADETGGTFRTASNADELSQALTVVTAAPPEPDPAPEPVKVTIVATDGPGGRHITTPLIWSLSSEDDTIHDQHSAVDLAEALLPGTYRVEVLRPEDEASAEATFGVGKVNKTVVVELPEFRPPATLDAPESAVAGATVQVGWTGPDAQHDYIAVGVPGDDNYVHYTYTRHGPLLDLVMPPSDGNYEIRYVLNEGAKVLATRPITVTPVTALLSPSTDFVAGGTAQVMWQGPDYERDYIAIGKPGDDGYVSYVYTRHGSPAEIAVPAEPGTYELRYVMNNKATVLATMPIEVQDTSASVTSPGTAEAGSRIKVAWQGPDNERDYVAVFPKGSDKYVSYAYTGNGNPAEIAMPAIPGAYELAYVLNTGNKVIARADLTIVAAKASVTAPATLEAGARVDVPWQGPGNKGDYIALFRRGTDDYVAYAYAQNGNPARLTLPGEPGDYDLAYVLDRDNTVLTRVPVTLTAAGATLSVDGTLEQGGTVSVTWTGPGTEGDYIAVLRPGTDDYTTYSYTRDGNPLTLRLPAETGPFEIAYVLDSGNTVIERLPVTLTPATASLTTTGDMVASGQITVDWTGPGNQDDWIAVMDRGSDSYHGYAYTRDGGVLTLTLPEAPGEYDLVYVLGVSDHVLMRQPITVK